MWFLVGMFALVIGGIWAGTLRWQLHRDVSVAAVAADPGNGGTPELPTLRETLGKDVANVNASLKAALRTFLLGGEKQEAPPVPSAMRKQDETNDSQADSQMDVNGASSAQLPAR